jgi:hypothetical protein
MKNIEFCYWLQGYFEISSKTSLNATKLAMISGSLNQIHEPFGEFTHWLSGVLKYLDSQKNNKKILDFFELEIKNSLNQLFHHVVE